jgi:ubiquinone/menaquinone biosynthesis C-methylase UbiE
LSEKRQIWERQWQQRSGEDFHWYLTEAPRELMELMERPDHPTGGALDLGCGNGVGTAFLATHFHPAVGLDIAHAATKQGKDLAGAKGVRAEFVVAEAPTLPFRDQAFGLVFDRGCLQAIPRSSWPTYFNEVDRVLVPGGMLQLYVSRQSKRPPKLLSARGLRARIRRLQGGRPKGGPSFLSPGVIREVVPDSFRELALEQFEFHTKSDVTRQFVYALFKKG